MADGTDFLSAEKAFSEMHINGGSFLTGEHVFAVEREVPGIRTFRTVQLGKQQAVEFFSADSPSLAITRWSVAPGQTKPLPGHSVHVSVPLR
ncbi:MAG TPA: hypothetical protein VJ761_13690 [Ktedonobacteraceae bacterium]|nr:hypothetical protein [Ktedonobacteraceae bacterium]